MIVLGLTGTVAKACQSHPDGRLLITELMADPEPAVGLPPYEYAELYNPGSDTVDLSGWTWRVGGKERRLDGWKLPPGTYAILCPSAVKSLFVPYGPVVPLSSFPALRNSGDRVTLIDPGGIAVHSVAYSPALYDDALKASGGWSLELCDTAHYCRPDAWRPSADPSGGTPGRPGSACQELSDDLPLEVIRAARYDEETLVILLTGNTDPFLDASSFSCSIGPGSLPVAALPSPEPGFPGLFFRLPEGLDPAIVYTLDLSGTIVGCSGQLARLHAVRFALPSIPVPGDIVLSEILFDPAPGETEFVELFNRSDKVFDLKGLILARADTTGRIRDFSAGQDLSFLLFPGDYAVMTPDGARFQKAWPDAGPAVISERRDMPSLTNTASRLLLLDPVQQILDSAAYAPEWHDPYLDDTKGISLERMDLSGSGTERRNWFSAASGSGGSTPGAPNSCAVSAAGGKNLFNLDRAIVRPGSPDGSGRMILSCRFGNPGWFMRIVVFSRSGIPVRELFPFGSAPAEGVVAWDGLDDDKRLVPEGIYLLVADYYHPSGRRGRWRKACAVVRDH
jgi:hypothetical protein